MIRSLTATVAGTLLAGATAQAAPAITVSGNVDAGYKADLNTFESSPKSGYNLEGNFTLDAKYSENVSVQIYAATLAGAVPYSFKNGVDSTGAYDGRWPVFAFDGVALTWKLDSHQTVVIGDVVVAKGSIGYYAAKRFSTVTRVTAVRGASYSYDAFTVYGGANDAVDTLFSAGASYLFQIDSNNTIEPSALAHFGIAGDVPWSGGLQYKGKYGSFALSASGSVYGGKDTVDKSKVGFVAFLEPSWATDDYYVSAAALFAPKAKDGLGNLFAYPVRHGRSYAAWGDDMMFYIEPGVNFAKGKAAFGLPVEFHDPNLDASKDETISLVPSFYLYPAKDITITPWGEVDFPTDSGKDPTYILGLESVVKF